MTEVLEQRPVDPEQTHQAVPSAFGMLVYHGQLIHFQVVDMKEEIVETDEVILVSSRLPKNGPEPRNPNQVPSQSQRLHMYLDAKERLAVDNGELAEVAPNNSSLSYREVSLADYWLARRLSLFDSLVTTDAPEEDIRRPSER